MPCFKCVKNLITDMENKIVILKTWRKLVRILNLFYWNEKIVKIYLW